MGNATNLGLPVKERDSFLGLYFPYWNNFGRWYHVLYPTSEEKFRSHLAAVPYDYNIALINDSNYWGVGNFRSHTAIPAKSPYFSYLLYHELGHYFGLNEEYEGGGRTELEFAANIKEPWSQNIVFLPETGIHWLKWEEFVSDETPIPTPETDWKPGNYGAYRGGYADSISNFGKSHKPGYNCVMNSGPNFCEICKKGIRDVILHDIGIHNHELQ